MALDTLKGKSVIGGYAVKEIGSTVGEATPTNAPQFVTVNHDTNTISFTIQNGPIGEAGINGCQVDTMAETVRLIVAGLNDKFPSPYNVSALNSFTDGINHLTARTVDRTKRGVEGTSQA